MSAEPSIGRVYNQSYHLREGLNNCYYAWQIHGHYIHTGMNNGIYRCLISGEHASFEAFTQVYTSVALLLCNLLVFQ